jgi:class 3 adenylate cyclase
VGRRFASFKFQVPGSHSLAPSTEHPASSPWIADPGRWTPRYLAERIRVEQAARETSGATDEERKVITALFADLAGFTALAKDLDPEETRAIIDPALKVMMDAVHRYEGYVAQSLGDGIFALFGAPIAHEDHPQRALYAALLRQEEMRRYAERIRAEKGVPLQIRVGINTGEVVLRSVRTEDLHTDYVPVGHSTNLASRMEGLATPGSIVVSEHTYKLIEGYFDCQALGATQVKGIETPIHIYEVRGVGPLRTRLQVAAKRGLVRFVGRQWELDQLKHALDHAIAGRGQVDEGLLQIHQGLDTLQAIGARVFRTYWLALLADAYGRSRATSGRAESSEGGAKDGRKHWGALVGGRALPAEGATDVAVSIKSKTSQNRSRQV